MNPHTLEMPKAEPNGFIKTLNNMGFMTSGLDAYSRQFVEFSAGCKTPVMDVGAAYGVATIAALEAGARVIANDIDARHLEILRDRVPADLRGRLDLLPGKFPEQLAVPPEGLGAILICRVLHFFRGEEIEAAARQLRQWLVPGGKLFIVAETPYLKNFQAFIPTFEQRMAEGAPWPGAVENVQAIAPERGASLPSFMHFLDPSVLRRTFEKNGFVVEQAATFARPEFPEDLQLDGRESVGLVASKPKLQTGLSEV